MTHSYRVRQNIITNFSTAASRNAEKTCQSKIRADTGRLSTIKCECGEEILFQPNVKAMGEAIEVHVSLHMQKLKAPACTAVEAEHLRDALIAQVFTIASQSENEGTGEDR